MLIHFPTDKLKSLIDDGTMPDMSKMKHTLKMTNTSGIDLMDLHCNHIASSNGDNKQRATSFDLIFFLIPKEWDAGKGFHFNENITTINLIHETAVSSQRLTSIDGCNWFQRKNGLMWEEAGVYSTDTLEKEYAKYGTEEGSDIIFARQRFDIGYEDISLDVTEIVNKFITGELPNYGIGIAFTPRLELSGIDEKDSYLLGDFCDWVNKHKIKADLSGQTLQSALDEAGMPAEFDRAQLTYEYKRTKLGYEENYVGFFTNKTNTFFEPYVETVYDDCIIDDRSNFVLDKVNRLYFYASVGGNPINLDQMPTCRVIDDYENDLGEYEVRQTTKGAYYIELMFPSSQYEPNHMFHDVWGNIVYNGVNFQETELDFTLSPSNSWIALGSDFDEIESFSPSLSGIKTNEQIRRGDVRKLKIDARIMYDTKKSKLVDDTEIRLYVMDGTREIDVLPFHKVNKTNNELYTLIDTSELIPQKYHVDVKFKYNMQEIIHHDVLYFRIVDLR